jgi:hypothetical protein
LKTTLNSDIWSSSEKIYEDLRLSLIELANDYVEYLELDKLEIKDIQFTGSLANYNWSAYSDIDLHIIIDKSKYVDVDVVELYLDSSEKLWKHLHDINIKGFPIEIYCQDVSDEGVSSGVYSLLENRWLKKPSKVKFVLDSKALSTKAEKIMRSIDNIIQRSSTIEQEKTEEDIKKIWKKIKRMRQNGLESGGEFSIENLTFKYLRRNGYISKLLNFKRKLYDLKYKNEN